MEARGVEVCGVCEGTGTVPTMMLIPVFPYTTRARAECLTCSGMGATFDWSEIDAEARELARPKD